MRVRRGVVVKASSAAGEFWRTNSDDFLQFFLAQDDEEEDAPVPAAVPRPRTGASASLSLSAIHGMGAAFDRIARNSRLLRRRVLARPSRA